MGVDRFNLEEDSKCVPNHYSAVPLRQDSPGEGAESTSSLDATLSEVRDKLPTRRSQHSTQAKRTTKAKRVHHRGVPMQQEFFLEIGWTRSFISGPANPSHNPHMVWCHMCKKKNFSVKTKGTAEILKHHRTEKHLRKEQRWRYEHLKSVNPVTGRVQHRVRGRNGKILSETELAHEFPKFIHTEHVDVGEKFSFYEVFLKGSTTAFVTPLSRAKTQMCLIGDFVLHQGDLTMLRNLWSRVGSFHDYQTVFHDFDWSEEQLTVSSFVNVNFHIT